MHSRMWVLARDLIAAIAILALGLSLALAGRDLGVAGPTESVDALLGLASSVAGLTLVGGWLLMMCLAMASALLEAAGRHGPARWAAAVTPAFMRRLAFGVLGASLVAGPAAHASSGDLDPAWRPSPPTAAQPTLSPTPSQAPWKAPTATLAPSTTGSALGSAPGPSTESATGPAAEPAPASRLATPTPAARRTDSTAPARAAPEPAWTPSRPVPLDGTSGGPLVRAELRADASGRGAVEVRPGDTLWRIAARHLGPGATTSDVADAWPRWFESNRAAIGDDPDLIRPGLLLVPPDG